jgi:hypothetical protein
VARCVLVEADSWLLVVKDNGRVWPTSETHSQQNNHSTPALAMRVGKLQRGGKNGAHPETYLLDDHGHLVHNEGSLWVWVCVCVELCESVREVKTQFVKRY